ncbi:hypothetical protein ANN_22397 [Periplaneta americana]|uniref:Uncharacterized protein n=1 Tax=Periplaneta americana TaxID=6978 RepID=A0ABQ8S8C3_PERAM|nr:hypothetical protein ANN_22397 [Periplaneta americana]
MEEFRIATQSVTGLRNYELELLQKITPADRARTVRTSKNIPHQTRSKGSAGGSKHLCRVRGECNRRKYYKKMVMSFQHKTPRTKNRLKNEFLSLKVKQSKSMLNFLAQRKVTVLTHSPYSPDLAPAEFFLFLRLKLVLKGLLFADVADITQRVTTVLRVIPQEAFANSFQKLYNRSQCADGRCRGGNSTVLAEPTAGCVAAAVSKLPRKLPRLQFDPRVQIHEESSPCCRKRRSTSS